MTHRPVRDALTVSPAPNWNPGDVCLTARDLKPPRTDLTPTGETVSRRLGSEEVTEGDREREVEGETQRVREIYIDGYRDKIIGRR